MTIYIGLTFIGLIFIAYSIVDFLNHDKPVPYSKTKLLDQDFGKIPLKQKLVYNNSMGEFNVGKQVLENYEKCKNSEIISPTKEIKAVFKNACGEINRWPNGISNFLNQHVAKIFVVKNLKSTARVDFDTELEIFYVFIDSSTFHLSANEWMNKTEFSLIEDVPKNISLNYIIENSDSAHLTIANILLHEIGHVIGYKYYKVPNWQTSYTDSKKYPLISKEFKFPENHFIPREKNEKFKKLQFYSDQKINLGEFKDLLFELEKTSFPTLYSTRNGQEYFAELFYSYVHCILQSKPFRIEIIESNEKTIFENGILNERCVYERNKIEELIKTLPNKG